MSEIRTRATPPATAFNAASSLARIPALADPSAIIACAPWTRELVDHSSVAQDAGDIGDEQQLVRMHGDGDRRRRVVAVDVERGTERAGRVTADRRDHRQVAARQQVLEKRDVDATRRSDVAHCFDVDWRGGDQSRVLAGQPDCIDSAIDERGHKSLVRASRQRHANDADVGFRRYPPPADERRRSRRARSAAR